MSFEAFKESKQAALIGPLLSSAPVIAAMESLSLSGTPAVAAIDSALAGKVNLSNTERQYVGRWIRDVLHVRGWRTLRQRRLTGGRLFTSGMVYARREEPASSHKTELPAELLPLTERLLRAQELVRSLSTNTYSVDDFIRDKYAEAGIKNGR